MKVHLIGMTIELKFNTQMDAMCPADSEAQRNRESETSARNNCIRVLRIVDLDIIQEPVAHLLFEGESGPNSENFVSHPPPGSVHGYTRFFFMSFTLTLNITLSFYYFFSIYSPFILGIARANRDYRAQSSMQKKKKLR